MKNIDKEQALHYHEAIRPGKIEIMPTKPYADQRDLSLAYSPGVAWPCLEIEKDPADIYRYTNKGNLVAVVSNGTAVLGLGNIGAKAAKPVMEGKALLFKIFAGLDAFDIELDLTDVDKIVEAVKAISPGFGGINLEDIRSPQCFYIERKLKEICDIPVMHDDQHGTAIISGAALLNALELQGKKIDNVRVVVNGAGAAAMACARFYIELGVRKENIVMCDRKGIIVHGREEDMNEFKMEFAIDSKMRTLTEALVGADVFLGLSTKNVLTTDMVRTMAPRPIIFALANPDPEIDYYLAKNAAKDVIVATGRSDFPNQVNNVLGFPYIFRGALDCHATSINEPMKVAACRAIADIAKLPVPKSVKRAFGGKHFSFGPDYILPKPMDPRLLPVVASEVAKAAAESGVARNEIIDYEAYRRRLRNILGHNAVDNCQ